MYQGIAIVMDILDFLVHRTFLTVEILLTLLLLIAEGRHSRRNTEWILTTEAPEILPGIQNITVYTHDRVVLKCTVRNRRTKDIQWRLVHHNYPLSVGMDTWTSDTAFTVVYKRINETDEEFDLIIKSATPKHTNTYECQISSKNDQKRYVFLKVLDKPRKNNPSVSLTGTAYLDIHQKMNLTCNATGSTRAPEEVDWFHNGAIIDPNDPKWSGRLHIYKRTPPGRSLISELIIRSSTLADQGRYVCRSSENKAQDYTVMVLDNNLPNKTKRTDKMASDISKDHKPNSGAYILQVNLISLLSIILLNWS